MLKPESVIRASIDSSTEIIRGLGGTVVTVKMIFRPKEFVWSGWCMWLMNAPLGFNKEVFTLFIFRYQMIERFVADLPLFNIGS